MKLFPVLKWFLFVYSIVASLSVYSQSGKLLILTSGDSGNSDQLISVDQNSKTELIFPNEFRLNAGTGRIQITKERILSIPTKALNNEFLGGNDMISSCEWKTNKVSTIKYPLDSGSKILRGFLASLGDLKSSVFQELHSNGEQRLYTLDGEKPMFLLHFDKFRKTAVLRDFISSGAHIFSSFVKDKTVQKLESSFVGARDGFSQKLYYCNTLNCKPEEVLNDKAIFGARLINNGKQIVFLTPVSVDKNSKYYNLESYDIIGKKRTKLWSFKTLLKYPSGRIWNLGNPTLRVFEQSSLILFSEEISEKGEDYIQNWKMVDVEIGKVEDFKVPSGYEWAPMMPVSYHTSSNHTDVTAFEPFLVFVKPKYLTQGTAYNLKVIQLPQRKTILDFVLIGNSTLINAIYVPDSSFL